MAVLALAATGLVLVAVVGVALSGISTTVVGGAFRGAADVVTPGGSAAPSEPAPTPAPTPAASPAESAAPSSAPREISISSVASFDPEGDGTEHPEQVARVTDGDPATAWSTDRYNGPDFGGLKSGVGLAFDLGEPQTVAGVTVEGASPGTRFELRAGDSLGDLVTVASGAAGSGTVELTAATPAQARYVVLWLRDVGPAEGGGFRGSVGEVRLHGVAA